MKKRLKTFKCVNSAAVLATCILALSAASASTTSRMAPCTDITDGAMAALPGSLVTIEGQGWEHEVDAWWATNKNTGYGTVNLNATYMPSTTIPTPRIPPKNGTYTGVLMVSNSTAFKQNDTLYLACPERGQMTMLYCVTGYDPKTYKLKYGSWGHDGNGKFTCKS